ncbi:hypothetical protein HYV85_05935 [Candidatus Woesearchaeota archaeon]|nr:hypothetical protein [Candidatus Woesearchaeota archaeon]
MSIETVIELLIKAWDKVAYEKMNQTEKIIYYIGLLFNATGTVISLILLFNGWSRWWAPLSISWMIGIPMIWGARTYALKKKG